MAERYRKHVYCEKKFLEHCIKTIAEWKFCEESFEELRLWMCIKALIFSPDIVLHLNITSDEIDTIENKKRNELTTFEKNIRDILDCQHQNSDGSPGIKLITRDFVTVDNINKSDNKQLTAYYLTCCDCKTCQQCMDECGVLAICPENINNFKSFFSDNGTAIDKNDEYIKSWKSVLKFCPCNSIALVDNYILTDTNMMNENLADIFDALLPKKLNVEIPFQISIFTTLKSSNLKFDINSEDRQNCIEYLIRKIRPNLRFNLSIFKVSKDKFHDRSLVSNNFYVSCGGGFDLFKEKKSTKMTTINIVYPVLSNSVYWTSAAYSNFIKEVSSVFNRTTSFDTIKNNLSFNGATIKIDPNTMTGFYVGDKQNRLCELIK